MPDNKEQGFSQPPEGKRARKIDLKEAKNKTKDFGDLEAKDLTKEKSIDEKADEIVASLWEAGRSRDPKGLKIFDDPKLSPNRVAQIFLDTKPFIIENLKKGAEFVGYTNGGIILSWFKDGKVSTEINPVFLKADVKDLLNPKARLVLRNKQLEINESRINEAAKAQLTLIASYLKETNQVDKRLSTSQIEKSDCGQEIMELIKDGYKNSIPYVFLPEPNGFVLKNYFSFGGLPDQHFDLRTFDKNLNYPKESAEQKTDKYINEVILPYLQGQRPNLSKADMLKSFLVSEEVKPILLAGFEAGKKYEFQQSPMKFTLKSGIFGFSDQEFDLSKYDENLNIKKPTDLAGNTKSLKEIDNETMEERYEVHLRKTDEMRLKIKEIQETEFAEEKNAYDEMMVGAHMPHFDDIKNQMESLAAKNPEVASLNEKVAPIFDYLKNEIDSGEYSTPESKYALMDQTKQFFAEAGVDTLFEALYHSEDPEIKAALELYGDFAEAFPSSLGIEKHSHQHGSHGGGSHEVQSHGEGHVSHEQENYETPDGTRLDDDSNL